jgi:hypothetical protein
MMSGSIPITTLEIWSGTSTAGEEFLTSSLATYY